MHDILPENPHASHIAKPHGLRDLQLDTSPALGTLVAILILLTATNSTIAYRQKGRGGIIWGLRLTLTLAIHLVLCFLGRSSDSSQASANTDVFEFDFRVAGHDIYSESAEFLDYENAGVFGTEGYDV